VILERF